MSAAILLIAHGSRRPQANAELVEVARSLQQRLSENELVQIAYLELATPTIPEGLQRCIEQGATDIRMLPYFLSPGAHVVDDLEKFRSDFTKEHPHVSCRVSPPIGLHPLMIDILLDRLHESPRSAHVN